MGFPIRRENKEIVHVNDEPSFDNHVSEGIIHEPLECSWGVGKPEEYDCWFEEPFMGDEGSLSLVAVFDVDIVIAPPNIKLGE